VLGVVRKNKTIKMKKVIAYADEFGTNSFDLEKQSTHFIIASVIINIDELDIVNIELEKIRKHFFQTGELKSQKISNNHKRRELILKELNKINYSIYALVVDKRKLFGEGFKYKQSFYKYLNGILYKEIYRTFPQIDLVVDELGQNDFMRSFKKYVQNNHIRDLFSGSDLLIQKSHSELGIQLADIIAGTLGYIYDEHKKGEHSAKFMKLLSEKIISINNFPKNYDISEYNDNNLDKTYDKTIVNLSLNRIFDYLDTTEGINQKNLDSINFLKLLIRYHEANHPRKYTTANEFIRHLNVNRENDISKETFVNLIGRLRDKGILISSSRAGYKIPTNIIEIKNFIRHGNDTIFPMLRRINECRKAIKLATNNSLDILEENEFKRLKELIDEK
jgi:hypothetical protein